MDQRSPVKSDTRKRATWWVVLVFVLIALINIAVVIWFSVGFHLMIDPLRYLDDARTQWQATGIQHYRLTVLARLTLRENSVFEITVENGTVTEAYSINPGTFQFDENPPRYEITVEEGGRYTVMALFDRAERLMRDFDRWHFYTNETSHVRFNESLGYPEMIVINTCGLLLNFVDECVTRYEVLKFEVINNDGE